MKKIIIIYITIIATIHAFAQDDHVRKLENYPRNSSIKISEKYCTISSDKDVDSFMIVKGVNGMWHAKNSGDTIKIKTYRFSDVQIADLKMQYDTLAQKKYAGLSLIEQLINRANDIGGSIKFINDKKEVSNNNVLANNKAQNEILVNEDDTDLLHKQEKNNDVLLYYLAGLLAIVSGLLIAEKIRNNRKKEIINKEDMNANKNEPNMSAQIVQLQNTNTALMAQIKEVEQQYKKLKDDDVAYFENALSTLVNPAKQALNKQNKQDTIALALRILTQYIAITHTKTNRRQGSDDYNVKIVNGAQITEQEKKHTIIRKDMASDAIPNEMKTILQILQDNNVPLPIGLSYMGSQFQ